MPYVLGQKLPKTAERLMRSRYSAYVAQAVDYIWETQDPKTRSMTREEIGEWAGRAKWLGLEIVETKEGGENDEQGVVEFRAKYFAKDVCTHHERSTFVKRDDQWFYLNGSPGSRAQEATSKASKVPRNAPCPCGSGSKYKRCCGRT